MKNENKIKLVFLFYLFITKKKTTNKTTGAQFPKQQLISDQSRLWRKNKKISFETKPPESFKMENEIINIFRFNLEKMDSKIEILQNNLNSGTAKSYK